MAHPKMCMQICFLGVVNLVFEEQNLFWGYQIWFLATLYAKQVSKVSLMILDFQQANEPFRAEMLDKWCDASDICYIRSL